jgi:methionyl-tRNA synthetase
MAAGYEVPRQIFVHGFLVLDDRKISKSLGNVIDPLDLVDVYGVDPVRYYVARVARFGHDGNASVGDLHERYERELGNDLGNLLSRTTAMIARYRGGSLGAHSWGSPLRPDLDALGPDVGALLDDWDLSGALDRVWQTVRALNRHVEETAPWRLAKEDGRAEELDRTLYDLADGLRSVAVAVAPYLPESAPRILAALGQPVDLSWERIGYGKSEPAEGIAAAEPLFPRVEPAADAA